jgi:predicted transcriptional regulator
MARTPSPRPTDAELAILQVLWQLGPSTVRAVHAELGRVAGTGYTTVLKTMQIMFEKGLLERDTSQRAHVYTPARPAEEVRRSLVHDLAERAFEGSVARLVLQALSDERASAEELTEIRRFLDRLESGSAPDRCD